MTDFVDYNLLNTSDYKPYTFSGFANGSNVEENLTFESDNDIGLAMLLDGVVDAVWIYADQANSFQCDSSTVSAEWNCEMWGRFGTEFAYIHTGMDDHAVSGTTLSMHKKGSGMSDILNPCLESFKKTEAYKDICEEYGFLDACIPNEFFPDSSGPSKPWTLPTTELEAKGYDCDDGYCNCNSR